MWTADTLFEKLRSVKVKGPSCDYTWEQCQRMIDPINRILQLKKEKKALILAHSYVSPEIVHTIADVVGDSYGLGLSVKTTDKDIILFPAVRFMAETAKIINPTKIVLDPNPNGGCSLADSITAEDVSRLKKQYPNHTFVCYINTTAAVKALCDVCVTSSNVYKIIEAIENDKIYFLPDQLMGKNIERHLQEKGIQKEFLYSNGTCYVHEQYDLDQVNRIKASYPNAVIIAHPECKPEVTLHADVVSSTTGMIDYVKKHSDQTFVLLTECGITSRLQVECPSVKTIGSCMMCRYMRSNSLESIEQTLTNPLPSQHIEIEPTILKNAAKCIDAMFHYANA